MGLTLCVEDDTTTTAPPVEDPTCLSKGASCGTQFSTKPCCAAQFLECIVPQSKLWQGPWAAKECTRPDQGADTVHDSSARGASFAEQIHKVKAWTGSNCVVLYCRPRRYDVGVHCRLVSLRRLHSTDPAE